MKLVVKQANTLGQAAIAALLVLLGVISWFNLVANNVASAQTASTTCNTSDTQADVTVTHCLVVLVRNYSGKPISDLHVKFLSSIYKVQPGQNVADLGEAVTDPQGKAAIDVTGWPLNSIYNLGITEPLPDAIKQNTKLMPTVQLRGQDLLWPDFGLKGLGYQGENYVKFVLVTSPNSGGGWLSLDVSYPGDLYPKPNSTGPDGSGSGGAADPGKGVVQGTTYISIGQYQQTAQAQTAVVIKAQTAVAQMTPLNGGSNGGSSSNNNGNSLTPRSDRVGAGTPTPTYLPGYTPGLFNNYKQVPSNINGSATPVTAVATPAPTGSDNATPNVQTPQAVATAQVTNSGGGNNNITAVANNLVPPTPSTSNSNNNNNTTSNDQTQTGNSGGGVSFWQIGVLVIVLIVLVFGYGRVTASRKNK